MVVLLEKLHGFSFKKKKKEGLKEKGCDPATESGAVTTNMRLPAPVATIPG